VPNPNDSTTGDTPARHGATQSVAHRQTPSQVWVRDCAARQTTSLKRLLQRRACVVWRFAMLLTWKRVRAAIASFVLSTTSTYHLWSLWTADVDQWNG